MKRGYFGIGIYNSKISANIGTIWRTAHSFGADFIFTIGTRYKHDKLDTTKAPRHIPLFHFATFQNFLETKPAGNLIGIELDSRSRSLGSFVHPERCLYLLGAEDTGLSEEILGKCEAVVQLPGEVCLNVAVAGAIVLYDRINKNVRV